MPAIIAIDGPAGSGKTTLARRLADALDLPYLNTGLMYRALAARALGAGIAPEDPDRLLEAFRAMRFRMEDVPDGRRLALDGLEPGPELLAPAVEAVVSTVAQHPMVRTAMRDVQRDLGAAGGVIEGRDIGSVVFPDADVKLFLVADPSARAARRRRERGGDDTIEVALNDRDRRDARVTAPVPSPDAVVLDTGALDAEGTFAAAMTVVRERLGVSG